LLVKAKAPGKLILSGEHSVVYGAPALAVALEQSIHLKFTSNSTDLITITTDNSRYTYKIDNLQRLKVNLDSNYQQFIDGQLNISEVLESPENLLFYTLAYCGFSQAGNIDLSSSIPIGAGMGSSAACITAMINLCEKISNSPASSVTAFAQKVRFCERLQHGRGSLIDAATISLGGIVQVYNDQAKPLDINLGSNWYIWNSGTPRSSTGEVVEFVGKNHGKSAIWTQFAEVTDKLKTTLKDNQLEQIKTLVMQNHQLLCQIGVVPETIQMLINKIESLGGCAKVCGAGSIDGNTAGQVLLYLPNLDVDKIAQKLMLDLQPLKQTNQGAYCEHN
jgi:mevalonate kinase